MRIETAILFYYCVTIIARMPQKTVKSFKIPKEVLKQIGEKITQKVMHKIDKIISEKCREIIGATNLASANDQDVKRDINELKTSWGKIQANLANLSEKADHMLGSLTYIASEYNDFGTILSKISKEHKLLSQDVIHLQDAVAQSNKQLALTSIQLDSREQYGRRENLEIHGVPLSINEDSKKIIPKVAKRMNVQLGSCDISTAHRLFNYTDRTFFPSKEKNQRREKSHPPPIIMRFANRDKRNEIYSERKLMKSNPSSSSNLVLLTLPFKKMLHHKGDLCTILRNKPKHN